MLSRANVKANKDHLPFSDKDVEMDNDRSEYESSPFLRGTGVERLPAGHQDRRDSRLRSRRSMIPTLHFIISCILLVLMMSSSRSISISDIKSAIMPGKSSSSITSNAKSALGFSFSPSAPSPVAMHEYTAVGSSKVHYLVPATHTHHGLCASLSSALVYDAKPIILDWGAKAEHLDGYMAKIHHTRDYARDVAKPDDIVIMIDGFDVWLQKPLPLVVEDFIKSGHRILFGAEKNCYAGGGNSESKEFPFCTQIPPSPMPEDIFGNVTDTETKYNRPRYLNSGTIMGYAKDLLVLYNAVIEFSESKHIRHDQWLFLIMFYKNKYGIALDYYNSIIKPLYESRHDMLLVPQMNHPNEDRFASTKLLGETTPRLALDIHTQLFPGMIHFNGPKDLLMDFFPQMWWVPKKGEALGDRVEKFLYSQTVNRDAPNGPTMTYSELCKGVY